MGQALQFQQGDSWICNNSNCRAEIIVVTSSELHDGLGPRCACGSSMTRPQVAPHVRNVNYQEASAVLRKLDLLRQIKR